MYCVKGGRNGREKKKKKPRYSIFLILSSIFSSFLNNQTNKERKIIRLPWGVHVNNDRLVLGGLDEGPGWTSPPYHRKPLKSDPLLAQTSSSTTTTHGAL